jgi:hypothetical protein
MKASFILTPAESRRLLAKAVVQMDEVKRANEKGYVVLCGGVTNALIAQELLGMEVEPKHFTAGISARGVLCVTPPEGRQKFPLIIHRNEILDMTLQQALADFHIETVIIKGGNAIDTEGNVGVITSGFDGGTVAYTIGTVTSTGLNYIFPIGLEKLIPSVREAAKWTGAKTLDYSIGANFGMYCLSDGIRVTEIEALKILAGVEAKHIASGGVGGSEGAVVLIAAGEEENVRKAITVVESIKGEPPIEGATGDCEICRYNCCFAGLTAEQLPPWLRAA